MIVGDIDFLVGDIGNLGDLDDDGDDTGDLGETRGDLGEDGGGDASSIQKDESRFLFGVSVSGMRNGRGFFGDRGVE